MGRWKYGIITFAVGVVAMICVGLLAGAGPGKHASASTTTTKNQPVAATAACNDPQAVANLVEAQGFKPGQFTVGQGSFNLSLPAAESAAPGKYSSQPLNTVTELVSFLKSGTPESNALLSQTMAQSGATQAQALNPSNWTGFQLVVPSNWNGNTSFVNGHVVSAGTRKDPAGDIGWVLISPAKCQQVLASSTSKPSSAPVGLARGGCGNHELVLPVPPQVVVVQTPPSSQVTTPPATTPPTSQVTTPPTTTPPKTCYSVYGPGFEGTYPNCYKPAQSFYCQQNGTWAPSSADCPPNQADQPPQTGGNATQTANGQGSTTAGAPASAPGNTAAQPVTNVNTPAPGYTGSGSNSGATDGKTGVPSGSTSGGGSTSTGSDQGTSNGSCDSAACGTTSTGSTPNSGSPGAPG